MCNFVIISGGWRSAMVIFFILSLVFPKVNILFFFTFGIFVPKLAQRFLLVYRLRV